MRHQTCLFPVLLLKHLNFQKQVKHIKCFYLFQIHFMVSITKNEKVTAANIQQREL